VPVLAQGGNTSLSGESVPLPGQRGVIVSLARMRSIRHVDAANNSLTVDAGCVLAEVQRAAAEAGRLYPVSLRAEGSCQIAGVARSGKCGRHRTSGWRSRHQALIWRMGRRGRRIADA
jgi:FAD/FMN-containing dehydrogenase